DAHTVAPRRPAPSARVCGCTTLCRSVGTATATATVADTVTAASVDLTAATVDEGAGASYVFTATLSDASHGVTTIHTDLGDITITDSANTGTLSTAAGNVQAAYTDAS